MDDDNILIIHDFLSSGAKREALTPFPHKPLLNSTHNLSLSLGLLLLILPSLKSQSKFSFLLCVSQSYHITNESVYLFLFHSDWIYINLFLFSSVGRIGTISMFEDSTKPSGKCGLRRRSFQNVSHMIFMWSRSKRPQLFLGERNLIPVLRN